MSHVNDLTQSNEDLMLTSTRSGLRGHQPTTRHLMNSSQMLFLRVNISGKVFEILKKSVFTPHGKGSFLEHFIKLTEEGRSLLADAYVPDTQTYFFNRSSAIFENILDFYRTGLLHCPVDACPQRFVTDLKFWKINLSAVTNCCATRLRLPDAPSRNSAAVICEGPEDPISPLTPLRQQPNGHLMGLQQSDNETNPNNDDELNNNNDKLNNPRGSLHTKTTTTTTTGDGVGDEYDEEDEERAEEERLFSGVKCQHIRIKFWRFMENPNSSRPARVYSIISIVFILVSVLGLIVGSMEEFEDRNRPGEPHQVLVFVEYVCLGWFTFEYVARLLLHPRKCSYIQSPLNIIDALSIGPFYLELFFVLCGVNLDKLNDVRGALLMMRILRVMRVARLFRLARYSGVMKSCGKTLRDSYREVGMLVIFVGIMIILFSTTVYFLEKEMPKTKFTSIPATFWWCIVTITTVGYGDMTPESLGGRLVASLASIAGVVVLAFPITVIVENFYRYYRKDKDGVEVPRRIRGVAIV